MNNIGKKIAPIFIAIVSIVAVVAILLVISGGSEEHYYEDRESASVSAVVCEASNLDDAFFTSTTANTSRHEIKVTFRDEKINKIYYLYDGVYRSDDVADTDEAHLHAKYNIYMGEHGLDHGILEPSYSVVKSNFRLTLYVDNLNNINNTTAQFFFIDNGDADSFKDLDIEALRSYYEGKGFSCIISE